MRYSLLVIIIFLIYPASIYAYDDSESHPRITQKAIENASEEFNFNDYLANNLDFEHGIDTRLGVFGGGKPIVEWIKQGSTDEDTPDCRASNHFHDPTNKDLAIPPLTTSA